MDITDSQLSFENIPGSFSYGSSLYVYCDSLYLTCSLSGFSNKGSLDSVQKLPVGNTRESPFFKLIILCTSFVSVFLEDLHVEFCHGLFGLKGFTLASCFS